LPPTFVYLLFFIGWVGAAAAVWVVAGVLAVFPSRRRTGLRLASAMAGTFPGVITYQLLAAPVVAALLLAMKFFWKTLEPGSGTTTSNPAVITVSIIGALLAFAVVLGMSLAGFREGWRLGWALAGGEDFMVTARNGLLFRIAHRIRGRVKRSGEMS
jgi:hypothetical protein